MENKMNKSSVVCPKCGSNNVTFQLVNEQKKRGCLVALIMIFIKLILFFISFVIWLVSLIIPKSRKSKTNKYAVCQNCGHSWKFRG